MQALSLRVVKGSQAPNAQNGGYYEQIRKYAQNDHSAVAAGEVPAGGRLPAGRQQKQERLYRKGNPILLGSSGSRAQRNAPRGYPVRHQWAAGDVRGQDVQAPLQADGRDGHGPERLACLPEDQSGLPEETPGGKREECESHQWTGVV